MSKHTPGPWSVRQRDPHNIEDSLGRYVCLTNIYIGADIRTVDANARLIAAAPEMLEALEKAKKLADIAYDWNLGEDGKVEIDGEMTSTWSIRQEFKAAIAKATGQEEAE